MRSSRTRLYVVAAALIALAIVGFVVMRGRSSGTGAAKPATTGSATAADDPWGAGAGPVAGGRFGGRLGGPAGKLLNARPPGPPVEVSGIVRLVPGGTPVAGAEVAFMNETGENTATADGTGRYTIKVASNIAWKVHARSDTAVGYPESFVVSGDTPVRDLEVHPTALVRGKVVDTRGAAVPEAEVSVVVEAGARALLESALPLSTVADGAGRFELPALPGQLMVRGVRGLALGVVTLPTLAPGETAEVTVQLNDPGSVHGRVVDGDGAPVSGAKILAASTLAPGAPTEKSQHESAADGSFTFPIQAGSLRLEARHAGQISAASVSWVNSGGRLEDVVLTVAPPAGLRGKVVTTDGTPVGGAKVRLVANAVYDATTAQNGTFEVTAIAGQPYLVKVRHPAGMLDRQVAAWNGEEIFVMKPFGGVRVVVDSAGAKAGEVQVTIDSFLADGEPTARAPAVARFRGVGGTVVLANLEPGVYDLTVTTSGAGSQRVPRVLVTEGVTRDVKVALAAPVTVRGTVKSSGQPVAGAQIAIGARTAFSDSKGRWVMPDVAAGPVTVVVTRSGFGSAWGSGVAAADAPPIDVELRAGAESTVEGIGVVLAPAAQGAVISTVLPGSPAAGKLAVGDVIAEVGGTDVAGAPIDEIVARLRGPAGSSVSLAIRRGTDTSTVEVTRRRLVVPPGTGVGGLARLDRAATTVVAWSRAIDTSARGRHSGAGASPRPAGSPLRSG